MLVVWRVGKLFSSIPKITSGFAQLTKCAIIARGITSSLCFPVHTVNRMELDFVSTLHFDCGHHLAYNIFAIFILFFEYIKTPYAFSSGIVLQFTRSCFGDWFGVEYSPFPGAHPIS